MSITFEVARPRTETTYEPCPKCGATMGGGYGDPSCDYTPEWDTVPCGGYGITPASLLARLDAGLNVSSVSAEKILYELLGYGRREVDCSYGTLDPADVLVRLSLAEAKAQFLTEPTRETRGVYMDANGVGPGCLVVEVGYSEERILGYANALRSLAEQALAEGERITYG